MRTAVTYFTKRVTRYRLLGARLDKQSQQSYNASGSLRLSPAQFQFVVSRIFVTSLLERRGPLPENQRHSPCVEISYSIYDS